MLDAMDREGFGSCGNQYECEAVCPKRITVGFIAKLNHEYLRAGIVESGLPNEPESPYAESS
jgi:succinate dehydrogenase / fumarate reductase iron-sulfur subunit